MGLARQAARGGHCLLPEPPGWCGAVLRWAEQGRRTGISAFAAGAFAAAGSSPLVVFLGRDTDRDAESSPAAPLSLTFTENLLCARYCPQCLTNMMSCHLMP